MTLSTIATITDEAYCYCGHLLTAHDYGHDCDHVMNYHCGRERDPSCAAPGCRCSFIYGPKDARLKCEREAVEAARRVSLPTEDEMRAAMSRVSHRLRSESGPGEFDKDTLKEKRMPFEITSVETEWHQYNGASREVCRIGIRLSETTTDSSFATGVRLLLDRDVEYAVPVHIVEGFIVLPARDSEGRTTARTKALQTVRKGLMEGLTYANYVLGREKSGFTFTKRPAKA